MCATLLIVDDDVDLRDLLKAVLEETDYRVVFAGDGQEAIRTFYQERPDLVVLDVLMPGMSGWEVLQRIREVSDTPVIMLTALADVRSKVRGLKAGADDYLPKPFSPAELLARCEALLRRDRAEARDVRVAYEDGALRIDFQRHRVELDGEEVGLSPTEFNLLAALVRRPGTVMDPESLIAAVWGPGYGSRDSLRLYIRYLRQKLHDDASKPRLIETLRGVGHRYRPQDAPSSTRPRD